MFKGFNFPNNNIFRAAGRNFRDASRGFRTQIRPGVPFHHHHHHHGNVGWMLPGLFFLGAQSHRRNRYIRPSSRTRINYGFLGSAIGMALFAIISGAFIPGFMAFMSFVPVFIILAFTVNNVRHASDTQNDENSEGQIFGNPQTNPNIQSKNSNGDFVNQNFQEEYYYQQSENSKPMKQNVSEEKIVPKTEKINDLDSNRSDSLKTTQTCTFCMAINDFHNKFCQYCGSPL